MKVEIGEIKGFEYQCPSCCGCPAKGMKLEPNELDTRVVRNEHGIKERIFLCPCFSQLA